MSSMGVYPHDPGMQQLSSPAFVTQEGQEYQCGISCLEKSITIDSLVHKLRDWEGRDIA